THLQGAVALLQEGDLMAIECRGVIEAAAIAGHTRRSDKGPGRAGGAIKVSARRQGGRLEAVVGQHINRAKRGTGGRAGITRIYGGAVGCESDGLGFTAVTAQRHEARSAHVHVVSLLAVYQSAGAAGANQVGSAERSTQ